MAKRNQSFDNLSPEERNRIDGEKETEIIKIVFAWLFIIIELILLFKVPVLAIFLLLGYGRNVPSPIPSSFLKKKNNSPDNKADCDQSGQKAAKKYISRVTEAGAKEKRLEQLTALKNAGMLTEEEYKERRNSILAEE